MEFHDKLKEFSKNSRFCQLELFFFGPKKACLDVYSFHFSIAVLGEIKTICGVALQDFLIHELLEGWNFIWMFDLHVKSSKLPPFDSSNLCHSALVCHHFTWGCLGLDVQLDQAEVVALSEDIPGSLSQIAVGRWGHFVCFVGGSAINSILRTEVKVTCDD